MGSRYSQDAQGALDAVDARTPATQSPEFFRLNPLQKIPVLQDGEFTLRRLGVALEPASR
jgi:glutathione S-transferase